ncbi:defensin-1-like [Rhynchophorus ferrugineus]|uniref:Defensin n=2 Tax=Rhynchophorus ferrugineus TaxID=354439 RepID=A0A834HVN7_RHYFE|nr:hypothetical protein GWI33_017310 [Rhynchophorus ferrugineus]
MQFKNLFAKLILVITLVMICSAALTQAAAIKEVDNEAPKEPLGVTCNGHNGGTTVACTVHCMVDGYHYGVCVDGVCHCKN